jgi:hypothetical protein
VGWRDADPSPIGRKTYEGLAAAWPQITDILGYEAFAYPTFAAVDEAPDLVAGHESLHPLSNFGSAQGCPL